MVALCGRPTTGKSEVQRILHDKFGILPFDDGQILRRHCESLFNLSPIDTETQEGKAQHTVIQGVTWQNRKIIGEYGAALETLFGPQTVPEWAVRSAQRDLRSRFVSLDVLPAGYSFGSVRRDQGITYLNTGGIVLEVTRPGIEPSGNSFDEYNKAYVTHTYDNWTLDVIDMEEDFTHFFQTVLDERSNGELKRA